MWFRHLYQCQGTHQRIAHWQDFISVVLGAPTGASGFCKLVFVTDSCQSVLSFHL